MSKRGERRGILSVIGSILCAVPHLIDILPSGCQRLLELAQFKLRTEAQHPHPLHLGLLVLVNLECHETRTESPTQDPQHKPHQHTVERDVLVNSNLGNFLHHEAGDQLNRLTSHVLH